MMIRIFIVMSTMAMMITATSKLSYTKGVTAHFPSWVDVNKVALLQASARKIKPDVVVAQDGSGGFLTMKEALDHIPARDHDKIYVIHVTAGLYDEHIMIRKKQINIMVVGDGATKTVFTGHLNRAQGINHTMNTATFTVLGSGFICKDVGFQNTAGPDGQQAVALRVAADMAIFYHCRVDAYQDTLLADTHRQFYRNCIITGTIDFVFGDAAAIFQNCVIKIRKPKVGQQCVVTAHGRKVKDAPTGFVLQNCTITGDRDYMAVKDKFETYLGRPWKPYARIIIMQSFLDDVIMPKGWLPWPNETSRSITCWYSEYKNRGPGADMAGRVNWPGIKEIMSDKEAAEFTVGKFLNGYHYIKAAHVPFTPGLI